MWRTGTKSLSSSEMVRTILFEKEHVKPWVCQKQPLSVNRNATFIVDLSHLPSKKDVFAGDMGVWKHTGSPSQYFEVRKNRFGSLMEIVSLGKKCPQKLSCDVYRIKKNYSSHHAANDLSCTVIFLGGNLCSTLCSIPCVGQSKQVVYTYWDSAFRQRCSLTSFYYVTTAFLLTFHIRVAHTSSSCKLLYS